jgi:uncharacterized protein YjbI with pentapeptide repeats
MTGSNLSGSRLEPATLTEKDTKDKNRTWRTNLSGADLTGANPGGADLVGANLIRANLTGANLARATLTGTLVDGAKFSGAIFRDATLPNGRPHKS